MIPKTIVLVILCVANFIVAQNVNIPDANFKTYLVGNTEINISGNDEIQGSK